jgi:hypothetical protein
MAAIQMFNANSENTTILLPIANNLALSNDCISHLIKHSPCNIIVLYDFHEETDYIQHEKVKYIKNKDAKGLVRIWNKCIDICPTEYVVLTGWRSRPVENDFIQMFTKLNEGFGMVALKSLHFFAFSKYLLTKVGYFDTGFTTGQMEDTDFFNRCCLENVGIYVSDEIYEVSYLSTWLANPNPNILYYKSKWKEESPNLIMLKPEENYNDRTRYSGIYSEREYKTFDQSELLCPSVNNYFKNIFTNYIKLYN